MKIKNTALAINTLRAQKWFQNLIITNTNGFILHNANSWWQNSRVGVTRVGFHWAATRGVCVSPFSKFNTVPRFLCPVFRASFFASRFVPPSCLRRASILSPSCLHPLRSCLVCIRLHHALQLHFHWLVKLSCSCSRRKMYCKARYTHLVLRRNVCLPCFCLLRVRFGRMLRAHQFFLRWMRKKEASKKRVSETKPPRWHDHNGPL